MKEKGLNMNRKFKYVVSAFILSAMLVVFVFLGIGVWKEYRKVIIESQKNQLLLTAQILADHLEALIEGYEDDLNGLYAITASDITMNGEAEWSNIENYAHSHSSFIFDVILEDQQGMVRKSLMGNKVSDTYLVMQIDENINLYQSKLENGEIYLVLKRELLNGDFLSIIIDSKDYYQTQVYKFKLGTNGYLVVKNSDGMILMHPNDEQLGIHVINGRHKLYPGKDLDSLSEMTEKQLKGEEGIDEYYSYWWNEPGLPRVKKISAYTPIYINDDFLVVSAIIAYDDFYEPLSEGVTKLVMVFLGATVTTIIIVLYLVRLLLQRRKNTEKIAYLTELNQILEEMHQSEEKIAHQQRLQIIGTMTGGITHEFNNILTPILGYAELMKVGLDEGTDIYECAEEICEASAKAKEIIRQISSFSRKNMETVYKNLPAEKMLKRSVKMVMSICPVNIHLKEEINFENACILGNETQINQLVLNICVNAIHAIGHQEGTITIRGKTVESEELKLHKKSSVTSDNWSHYIRIDIIDTGCGMSQEILKRIFDPFFTTKKDDNGTGLGLALVEQIVSSHKGYVCAESHLGKGSAFYVYLPVNEQQIHKIKEPESIAELRLLIVDDNSKVLQLLRKSLKKLNISVTTCMNFEETRTILKQQRFDVLVIEQVIGGKSAVDFCLSIQGHNLELIKIVMIDEVTREVVEAKQKKIIDEYIDKPASDSTILNAARSLSTF